MVVHRVKILLWSGAGSLALACGATVALGWMWPYAVEMPTDHGPVSAASTENGSGLVVPPLSWFEPIWAMNLRRPLYDQPQPVTSVARPVKKAPPPLPIRLAGTVVEPGRSVAMFITAGGKIELKGEGDTVGEAEVLSIGQDGATVRYRGKRIELTLDQEGQR